MNTPISNHPKPTAHNISHKKTPAASAAGVFYLSHHRIAIGFLTHFI
jgi:hypothetical protein